MKTNKEYPATHSMSTAWYIVDEDGNVGIMDFEANGPVPYGLREDNVDYLAVGIYDSDDGDKYDGVSLTDEQVDELPFVYDDPEGYDFLGGEYVVKIDLGKEERFHELLKNDDCKLLMCLSKQRGIYIIIDRSDCESMEEPNCSYIKKDSTLQRLLEEKIIMGVCELNSNEINDDIKDDELRFETTIKSLPYYLYAQSYLTEFPQLKIHTPMHPVKFHQLSGPLQKSAIRLPLRFEDTDTIQIAEHVLSGVSGYSFATIDGVEYTFLGVEKGKEAWICTDENRPQDFAFPMKITEEDMNNLVRQGKNTIMFYD